ncbi:hypothetical protein KUV28_04145 [Ferrimonas balearica]|nr:hypothetical protein [Ferrimonas balearica]
MRAQVPPLPTRRRRRAPVLLGLAALVLLVLSGGARAQAILRSGDHANFTRLTLPLPEGTTPSVEAQPGRAILRFSGPMGPVDTSRVFDRIGRDRLTGVTLQQGPALRLDLACDCPVETSLTSGNLLILDILDGPALTEDLPLPGPAPDRPTAPVPQPLIAGLPDRRPPTDTAPAPLAFDLPSINPLRPGPVSIAAAAPPRNASARVPDAPARQTEDAPDEAPLRLAPVDLPQGPPGRGEVTETVESLTAPPAPNPETARLTRELEESLLAAIGSAATEGLLAADARQAAALSEAQRQVTGALADGVSPDPGLAATPSTFAPENATGDGRIILSGNPCALHMPPLVAIEDLDFLRELARLRAALTGEFDRDDVDAYHALAQLYLSHGFGAEARQVLETVQQPPLEAAEMASVARILEYGHDPEPSPFDGRLTCDTDAALWAALAPKAIPPGSDFDAAAIKRSLMAMPGALKAVAGPLLANRFMAAKEGDFARDILRIVERDLLDTSPRQALAAAKLANGDGPPSRADFAPLIAGNSDISPEALLHYTNETLAHGGRVDTEIIGLLESYRSQYRDGPLATDLARAEVLAQAALENFPAAFTLYESERDRFDEGTRAELSNALAEGLASTASDAIFTRLYFTQGREMAETAEPAATNALAARLLDLGLPETAEELLTAAPPARSDTEEARRLLLAQVALDMNLPRKAEAELEGLSGAAADKLRAAARLAREDFATARALYSAAGEAEAAIEAAWLARDWQALADAQAEKARLAEVVQQTPVDLPELGPPTLAASREVLDQSDETRSALRDLLSALNVPDQDDP